MHEDIVEGIPEDSEEELSLETPEELTENRKKRRYLIYGVIGFILVMVVLIVAFATGGSKEEELVQDPEALESNAPHPLVEMAKIKNVPLQSYRVRTPLIANTSVELIQNINAEGWIPSSADYSVPGITKRFTCLECTEEKIATVWLRIFSNDQEGRKDLYATLTKFKEDNKSIVSEAAEVGSGGFIVNDGETISYWFYYEPNIVARADMYHGKQGSLTETRDWAHRLNYSIYKVVGR